MRNRFPGTCYMCGSHVPTGYGFFELVPKRQRRGGKWRVKCVKCTDGRDVRPDDKEVGVAKRRRDCWKDAK